MIGSKKLGDIGEQMAERVYAEDGFQILETNFRCRSGEIDIIGGENPEGGRFWVPGRGGE